MEQYFLDRREQEIKNLLEKMAVEEQAAITRLIDKHSQEMLLMIQEKVYSILACLIVTFTIILFHNNFIYKDMVVHRVSKRCDGK